VADERLFFYNSSWSAKAVNGNGNRARFVFTMQRRERDESSRVVERQKPSKKSEKNKNTYFATPFPQPCFVSPITSDQRGNIQWFAGFAHS